MVQLAEVVDAVIGGDTHRDVHALELVAPNGTTLSTLAISNDEAGFAEVLAWIAQRAPGPSSWSHWREPAATASAWLVPSPRRGLPVIEIERPARQDRRRGTSDPIDAHLAAVNALRLDADRLPIPRADGDREALRILLGARHELVTYRTRMVNRLRALLLNGDEHDRAAARGPMSPPVLTTIARRRARRDESREQAVRRAEARRLALAIRDTSADLKDNKTPARRTGRQARTEADEQGRDRAGQRSSGDRVVVASGPLPP